MSVSPKHKQGLRAPAPDRPDSRRVEAATERLAVTTGVDPSETLAKLRAAQEVTARLRVRETRVVAELASYEARYAYPSHWEHERKALLSRLANHERDRLLALGQKVTDGGLDRYAHSHGEYRDFLDQARRQREEMESRRAELVEIRGEIETAKATEVYFERIARREDSIIWFSGREMGLER